MENKLNITEDCCDSCKYTHDWRNEWPCSRCNEYWECEKGSKFVPQDEDYWNIQRRLREL